MPLLLHGGPLHQQAHPPRWSILLAVVTGTQIVCDKESQFRLFRYILAAALNVLTLVK